MTYDYQDANRDDDQWLYLPASSGIGSIDTTAGKGNIPVR